VVERGRPHGCPPAELGHRRVRAECQYDPRTGQRTERVHALPPIADPLGVHAVRPAPERVEHRLDAGDDPTPGQRRDHGVVHHLDVLEAVARGNECLDPDLLGGELEAPGEVVERLVADAVEAGLHLPLGAGDDMVGDLLGCQVRVATVIRAIGVRLA
jgi:hypothetical protein